jgi:hypothetical protein
MLEHLSFPSCRPSSFLSSESRTTHFLNFFQSNVLFNTLVTIHWIFQKVSQPAHCEIKIKMCFGQKPVPHPNRKVLDLQTQTRLAKSPWERNTYITPITLWKEKKTSGGSRGVYLYSGGGDGCVGGDGGGGGGD